MSTTLTLTGGTVLLIWLAEQMTLRGVGNGLALLLCVGIVAEFASTAASTAGLNRVGLLSGDAMIALAGLTIILVALIAFMERARRLVPLEFTRSSEASGTRRDRSHLALKLNGADIMPAIIAGWFVYVPIAIAGIIPHVEQGWFATALRHMQPGRPAHMIFTAVVVAILALVYTAFVIDPEHAADSLQARGGAIPEIAPGEATADHLDRVVTFTTLIGAAYLVAVLLIPEALIAYAKVPYYFAGGSVLIIVCAVLDIEAQVRARSLTGRGGNSS